MKNIRITLLLALVILVSLAIPAWAEEPFINVEVNYWLPRFTGESESPVGLIYRSNTDSIYESVYLTLDPQPFWGVKASADMRLGEGRLELDYLQTGASASFGSLDDRFEEDDYNPAIDDMEYYDIEVWNDTWSWWHYVYGRRSLGLMSAGLHYAAPLMASGTTEVNWRVGIKGLRLKESTSLIFRDEYEDLNGDPDERLESLCATSQSIMAGGPMVGLSYARRLTPALNLYAGADIAALLGTAKSQAEWRDDDYYTWDPVKEEWVFENNNDSVALYSDSGFVLLPALDVNAGVSYAINKMFTIKAGVFATALPSVPSPREWSYWHYQWMKAPNRFVGVAGLTVGVKASF